MVSAEEILETRIAISKLYQEEIIKTRILIDKILPESRTLVDSIYYNKYKSQIV